MDIDFKQYIKAFQRYWWFIPATMLLSIGLGLAYSMSQTPLYEAHVSLVMSPKGIEDPRDLVDSLGTLARSSGVAITACRILNSPAVQKQAAQTLEIPPAIVNNYETGCVVLPDSTVLQLRVQGESPELAADYANAIGVQGSIYINELYDVLKLRMLASAEADPEPISPDHATNLMLSLIIGLIGGVGFIILQETLMQLWRHFSDADTPAFIHSTITALTLRPMTDREDNAEKHIISAVQEDTLSQQVRLFIEQQCDRSYTVLRSEKWQYLVIMLDTNKEQAEKQITAVMEALQAKAFIVPDADMSVRFTGSARISQNENNVVQWNTLLRQSMKMTQQADMQGAWRVDVA